jgi:SAM-dependent methyltransferase
MAKPREKVRRFFGEHSEAWLRRYYSHDFDSVSYQDRMQEALRLLEHGGRQHMRVLEVGCGAGVYSRLLQARGHEVFACDIALEMAQKARERIGSRTVVSVGEKLPFRPEAFDAVVALGVISYAADPEAFIASLVRVLRPSGVLIVSSVNHHLLLRRLSDTLSHWPNQLYRWAKVRITGKPLPVAAAADDFYRTHCNYMDARAFDRLLASAGLESYGGSAVDFGRLHFMGKEITPDRPAIALSRCLTRLSRRLPPLQRHSRIYVAAARKPAVVVALPTPIQPVASSASRTISGSGMAEH